MRTANSLEKTLMLGKTEGRRRRGRQGRRWLNGITDPMTWTWANSRRWWWTGRLGMLWFMRSQRVRHDWVNELNWTDTTFGSKAMTNQDSVLKSRDIALVITVHIVKAMFFPVVMYGCESWTIKKAKGWRTDVFEMWCWRRLLKVPWTARRST